MHTIALPLAKSWNEELVYEYFTLKGFIVYTDVPFSTSTKGGRKDLDILALDPVNKVVYLVDVRKMLERSDSLVQKARAVLASAEEFVRREYGNSYKYRKKVVLIPETKKPPSTIGIIREKLKADGIDVVTLQELIEEALAYIDEWRAERVRKGYVKRGTTPLLPENLYMMKLLEYLHDHVLPKPAQRHSRNPPRELT